MYLTQRDREMFPPDAEMGNLHRRELLPRRSSPAEFDIKMTPPAMGAWVPAEAPATASLGVLFRATETRDASRSFAFPSTDLPPERRCLELSVEKGDLLLRRSGYGGAAVQQAYEEEDYIVSSRLPHVSEESFAKLQNDRWFFVRRLGSENRTGLCNKPIPGAVGSAPMILPDAEYGDCGMVPLSILEPVTPVSSVLGKKNPTAHLWFRIKPTARRPMEE